MNDAGNSSTIASRISQLRKELNLNKTQFGASISSKERTYGHSVISRYESGGYEPKYDFYEAVERVHGYRKEWISTGELPKKTDDVVEDLNVKYLSRYEKPIYAHVFCGTPASQWSQLEVKSHIITSIKDKSAFGLIADGDSMMPYINPGDIIVCVDKPELIKNRTAVVVVLKSTDEVVCNAKYILLQPEHKSVLLYSNNTKYEPVVYRESEILKIYKVVQIIRNVK